ncbi:MAG: acetyl-CoA carboxylase, carboxyltransferase subunit beta [Ignavibacteriales bacterium]|nr:acetyl-CoA carboxylase, carboxyltransferase subunit beta [Ignavibacteriales bacterium]
MSWFKRSKHNIAPDNQKKDTPEGLWSKCDSCQEIITKAALEQNLWVCPKCGFHFRISSKEYFDILFDAGTCREFDKKITSKDPLGFVDTKRYRDRIKDSIKKTGLHDAIRCGTGKMNGHAVVIACMDFTFIGGSMGAVVGEKISRAAERAYKTKKPLVIISSSGGARMMEAAYSLMQMAKTSAHLARLAEAKIPYISIMTDPTTGGVTASFAMLGDVNIGEPGALIGFAGPRVIKQTIGKNLPDGFQKAEFVQEKGFLDLVVPRKEMKDTVSKLIGMMSA